MKITSFGLLLLISLATLSTQCLSAQSVSDRLAVIEPIQHLFRGMQTADTTGFAPLFHPNASLRTVSNKDGNISLRETEISRFVNGLANATPGDLLEELHYTEIRIDGDLATAWTPYTFVYQDQISHCGTNAFQLAKTGIDGAWQIVNIIDTRQREGCVRKSPQNAVTTINQLADDWHQAATDADADQYFGLMDEDAIFIGTDASEHWTKEEFLAFAKPYFDKGKAWDFKKIERHVFLDTDENIAYWDELLDTWMGPCRGTGIAMRQADGSYLIKHYTLSVTVANEKIEGFIALTKE
ncbi:MAG: nuclear transport factor 2 family protein [Bacteroidota bacterium]